jgi:4-amino-4-deoxy-L-arabinose transferase-like glycosyltransferase
MNSQKYATIFLVCGLSFSAVLIFLNLGRGSIDLWDESITAGRSLYVYNNHSLFDITVNGEISTRKPPLMYLLNAISFQIFGINEFALRLPNALFGLACFCVMTYGIYRIGGIIWASFSPWLLMGSYNLINASREALTDTVFVLGFLLTSLTLLFELKDENGKSKKWRWLYAAGVFFVLFGKGLVGIFLVVYILLFLFFFNRKLAFQYLLPTLVACIPLVLWMAIQYSSYTDFLTVFVRQEYLDRMNYSSDFLSGHIRNPFWYLNRLWSWFNSIGYLSLILSGGCLILMVKQKQYLQSEKSFIFLTGIVWSYLLIISLISHKLSRYILPLSPLFILLFLFSSQRILFLFNQKFLKYVFGSIFCISIGIGLYLTAQNYKVIPDYQPEQKAVSLKVLEYAGDELPVYTDSRKLAVTMHFYLNKNVPAVSRLEEIGAKKFIYVSKNYIPGSTEYSGHYIKTVTR